MLTPVLSMSDPITVSLNDKVKEMCTKESFQEQHMTFGTIRSITEETKLNLSFEHWFHSVKASEALETHTYIKDEKGWVFRSGRRGDSWVPALLMPEPGAVRIMAGLRATGINDHICFLAMEKPSYVPAFC
ncbi:hypothetical protein SRHO_G00227110 [Serrasalmus rhombeus]